MIDKQDIETLEKIAKGIDNTLDICDTYLSYNDFLKLNKIIVKLLTIEEKAEKFDKLITKMLSYKSSFRIDNGILYYCINHGLDGGVMHPLIRVD